jgi:Hypervirulence associated proteins TUDOR domain
MVKQFTVGDHARWNSEAGYVEGVIIKKHTNDVECKGYVHHCTESDPQYDEPYLHGGAFDARLR